jgi:hypothetical protein
MGLKETILEVWENVVSPMFAELGVEVDVEVLDGATAVDPLYGEAVTQKEYGEPVVLKARAKIEKDRLTTPGGEEIDVDGRITFRTQELDENGVALDFGSLISLGSDKYTVVHMEKTAQVGNQFLLVKVWVKAK